MADLYRIQGVGVPADMQTLYRDMGDGTHALVISANISGGTVVVTALPPLPAGTNNIGGVDVLSIAAGETHIGQMGGEGINVSQTPTVTAGAYLANDAVGGLLTFANAARVIGGSGVIKSAIILDDAGQDAETELWLFNATFVAMADNAPWAPSEADLRKLIAIITTENGAWFAAGTPSAAAVEVSQSYTLVGTSMFGQLVTRGTPTYAATDDVTVILSLMTD